MSIGSRVEVPDLRRVRAPASEQRRARWRAHRLLNIILLEEEALASERIDMRRDHLRAATALDGRAAGALDTWALSAELVAEVIDREKLMAQARQNTRERSRRRIEGGLYTPPLPPALRSNCLNSLSILCTTAHQDVQFLPVTSACDGEQT